MKNVKIRPYLDLFVFRIVENALPTLMQLPKGEDDENTIKLRRQS